MTNSANLGWHENMGNAAISWIASVLFAGAKTIWNRPVTVFSTLSLVAGLSFGVPNALWLQHARHPSPFFQPAVSVVAPSQPVIPAPVRAIAPATHTPEVVPAPMPVALTPAHMPSTQPEALPGNKDLAGVQLKLKQIGLFDGQIDGFYGPKTADAIRRFEALAGLPVLGAFTPELVAKVSGYVPSTPSIASLALAPDAAPQPEPAKAAPVPAAEAGQDPVLTIALKAVEPVSPEPVAATPNISAAMIRKVQTGLARLGFLTSEVTGRLDAGTARAIREFENYLSYEATGKVTSDLVDLLTAAGAYN